MHDFCSSNKEIPEQDVSFLVTILADQEKCIYRAKKMGFDCKNREVINFIIIWSYTKNASQKCDFRTKKNTLIAVSNKCSDYENIDSPSDPKMLGSVDHAVACNQFGRMYEKVLLCLFSWNSISFLGFCWIELSLQLILQIMIGKMMKIFHFKRCVASLRKI